MKLREFSRQDVEGKNVLLRVDFNVPLKEGVVSDTTRIRAHVNTIRQLFEWGAKVTLVSHLGRPKGKKVESLSLMHIVKNVKEILNCPVIFVNDSIGENVQKAIDSAPKGSVVLLENIRFYPEEEKNNLDFAKELAAPFDVFVMDAFSASHRAHASTRGVMEYLPSFAGNLITREIEMLSTVSETPEKPFVLILGGAKVSDKIGVIDHLLEKASAILIGGGMAYTFLAVQGKGIGKSLYEEDKADFAQQMLTKAKEMGVDIVLPIDTAVAESLESELPRKEVSVDDISFADMGLDIGTKTAALFASYIEKAKTVLWNGPMGVFENPTLAEGTRLVAKAVEKCTENGGITVVGGGDTASAVKKLGFAEKVTHVSTGGGASLEFCEGKVLPGIELLLIK
ncbi:MAG: phosphoglycerate kinase [Aminobacterium sp.]|nr:phosphoglycerate kinase [Aminobacterium sp.]MDD3425735.1 phosphoglycerate kinase [Aminobacterium sp.]MDD3707692.1 phosphoglycerate kinase [Aminobacterium sp.]MDD4228922.1 phosphoglycerate kinase [Aminobacterium sp.]